MQPGITGAEIRGLGFLDRFDELLGDELDAVVDAGQVLYGVENQRGTGAKQFAGLRGDDGAVGKLYGAAGTPVSSARSRAA